MGLALLMYAGLNHSGDCEPEAKQMQLGANGLETDLFRLEPLNETYRLTLKDSGAVDHVWTAMPVISTGTTFDDYFDHALKMPEAGAGQAMAAIRKVDQRLIGLAAFLAPNRIHRRLRIGYIWVQAGERGGQASAHVQFLMIKRALEWRARRIEWWFDIRDQRAMASIRKFGATHEGTLRKHTRLADGSWADVAILSLVGEEIAEALSALGERIGEAPSAPQP
jgi:RimJ/RimL family protein N-acetyltransferase